MIFNIYTKKKTIPIEIVSLFICTIHYFGFLLDFEFCLLLIHLLWKKIADELISSGVPIVVPREINM